MGTLVFQATLGGSVNLIGPNTASTINFTLPSADGSSGQALTTNGSGTLSFATVTTGAAGSTTQVQYNSSGAFAGSANLTFNGTTLTAANTSITTSETLSYGTANGVTYLNGSKVLTSGSALTFDGNQIAVTPVSGNAVSKLFGGTGAGVGSYFAVYAQGANSGYFGTDSGVTGSGTSNDLTIYPASTNNIRFYQSGAEQMRLTSTGLKVGTTSDFSGAKVVTDGGGIGILNKGLLRSSTNGVLQVSADPNNAYTSSQISFDIDGSTVATLDSAGNLGLGVTPSAWGIGKALQVNNASLMGYLNRLYANANTYFDGTGTGKYIASDYATSYQQVNGTHAWFNAASGTAGNAISFTQAMTLDASGNLLVGTTNSAQNAGNGAKILPRGNVSVVNDGSTGGGDGFDFYNSTASAYRFYVTGAGVINATNTTITAISDQRLKENIVDLDVGLDAIMALKPRKFDWKAGKGKDIKGDRGWIAQEFETVFPDLIDTWKDPAPEGEEPYKSVRADLIPILVKAIQEQQAIIQQLQADVAALKGN